MTESDKIKNLTSGGFDAFTFVLQETRLKCVYFYIINIKSRH
jgi:hypothetical protein